MNLYNSQPVWDIRRDFKVLKNLLLCLWPFSKALGPPIVNFLKSTSWWDDELIFLSLSSGLESTTYFETNKQPYRIIST